jgi:hypothetical protein
LDYIREINAFYDNDLANQLSQSAGYLYFALLNVGNRLFWKDGFTVSDTMLMARAGIKDKRTFRRAMEELRVHGLVGVRDTQQGHSYTIIGLATPVPNRNTNGSTSSRSKTSQNAASDPATVADRSEDLGPGRAGDVALLVGKNLPAAENIASGAASFAPGHDYEAYSGRDLSEAETKPEQLIKTKETKESAYAEQCAESQGSDCSHLESTPGDPDLQYGDMRPVGNRELIAELAKSYRGIAGIAASKGDYAFIGSLYNEYGYEQVLCAVHELTMAAATTQIGKPLLYLKAILRRAGPSPPVITNLSKNGKEREEDPFERYERERYRG